MTGFRWEVVLDLLLSIYWNVLSKQNEKRLKIGILIYNFLSFRIKGFQKVFSQTLNLVLEKQCFNIIVSTTTDDWKFASVINIIDGITIKTPSNTR